MNVDVHIQENIKGDINDLSNIKNMKINNGLYYNIKNGLDMIKKLDAYFAK